MNEGFMKFVLEMVGVGQGKCSLLMHRLVRIRRPQFIGHLAKRS